MNKLQDWENRIVCGSNPEALKPIPDGIISCVMTSFPYWGQRDYKVKGQMGLEKTFQEWLEKAWLIMDEIKRVLRKDGTCWINLGDKYGGSGMGMSYAGQTKGPKSILTHLDHMPAVGHSRGQYDKSLLFIPERFAIGCLDRGWILRNKCIWQKPNPMPCSAKDRFTTTWEYLFFMTKSKKYWFDLDAVRRPQLMTRQAGKSHQLISEQRLNSGGKDWNTEERYYNPGGKNPGDVITTKILEEDAEKMGSPRARQHRKPYRNLEEGSVIPYKGKETYNPAGANPGDTIKSEDLFEGMGKDDILAFLREWLSEMSNDKAIETIRHIRQLLKGEIGVGDFWSIPTQPSKLPHYASYPEKLCLTPLKAGCPRWICKECGMARCRVTKIERGKSKTTFGSTVKDINPTYSGKQYEPIENIHTLGWTFCSCLCPACGEADCKCGEKWRPGIVLDPFGGTGKTCIVAKKLGLSWLYIDLKPEYCEMAKRDLDKTFYQEELRL